MVTSKTAVVVGSGVAGLAVAIRLAVQGFAVDVYEKNAVPGGKLGSMTIKDYHFDTGPSLFTEPENIQELFALAGEQMGAYFTYHKVDEACRYFYPDGTVIRAFTTPELFAAELNATTGEAKDATLHYLSASAKLYSKVGEIFLNFSLHKWATWLNVRVIKAFTTIKPSYLFKTLNGYNGKQFKTPHAVQLFNRYATYNGSSPYRAPGMLSVIPHLEHNEGTCYPHGGMINIVNALYKLAEKKGITFHFGAAVSSIIHTDGSARGIVVNNKNIFSDIVVSNLDAYYTYKNLLGNPWKASSILKQERSSSALIFYWGINKTFSNLQLHNIFFSENYKEEFEHLFKLKKLYQDPTVYINITSRHDASHAPEGCENWFVMINVPADQTQDWGALKMQARQSIVKKINEVLQTDITQYIEVEEILDPTGIDANTGCFMGSLYGTSSNSILSAFWRHPNFSQDIKSLYFCGGSVHPGGGIPLCLRSAKIVAGLVADSSTSSRPKHSRQKAVIQ